MRAAIAATTDPRELRDVAVAARMTSGQITGHGLKRFAEASQPSTAPAAARPFRPSAATLREAAAVALGGLDCDAADTPAESWRGRDVAPLGLGFAARPGEVDVVVLDGVNGHGLALPGCPRRGSPYRAHLRILKAARRECPEARSGGSARTFTPRACVRGR